MTRALALVACAAALGASPFRAEEPHVREGNERVAAGQPEAALPAYDAAERDAGPSAVIEYDRGVALARLGRSAEARDAYRRALERGAGPLTSRAQQNLGSALLAEGDREGALAAFVEALRADPQNDDARFNLEVLLRRTRQEEARRAPAAQAQRGAGAEPDPRSPRTAPPRDRSARPELGGQAAEAKGTAPREAEPDRLSREDAARILDAFRERERSLPAGGAERRGTRRPDADRDW